MELLIDFPGGSRVDAHFGTFTVSTDQPPAASAPTPFDLFLASLGTCAGIYVLSFCQKRSLPTDGIKIMEIVHTNSETKMVDKVDLEIQVPATFPTEYHEALVRTAELCKVKKHIENPPNFDVFIKVT